MEDIHKFASNKYVAADRIQPNMNQLHTILMRTRLTLLTIGVFIFGVCKSIVARFFVTREPKIINGYVALVTGGANGLGRVISIALAKLGCDVAILDADLNGGRKTCEDIRNLGAKAIAYQVPL